MNLLEIPCMPNFLLKKEKVISVSGPDAETFLQGQTTNDVKRLGSGQGHQNCVLGRDGKLRAHFFLMRKVSDEFFILCSSEMIGVVLVGLQGLAIAFDFGVLIPAVGVGASGEADERVESAGVGDVVWIVSKMPLPEEAGSVAGCFQVFG